MLSNHQRLTQNRAVAKKSAISTPTTSSTMTVRFAAGEMVRRGRRKDGRLTARFDVKRRA